MFIYVATFAKDQGSTQSKPCLGANLNRVVSRTASTMLGGVARSPSLLVFLYTGHEPLSRCCAGLSHFDVRAHHRKSGSPEVFHVLAVLCGMKLPNLPDALLEVLGHGAEGQA